MLPEANQLFRAQGFHYPIAYIITGLTFLFFLWFEHFLDEIYHVDSRHKSFAILACVILSLHSLILGVALGIADHKSILIMLFVAIITHKWAESFAIAVEIAKSSLSNRNSLKIFIVFTLMTPLGIILGSYFKDMLHTHILATPLVLAVSAGTFFYLGTLHGLEQCVLVKKCCNLKAFSFVIIGFLLMAFIAIYL